MRKYEFILKERPEMDSWLKDRPINTKRLFAEKLNTFCNAAGVSPEEWRKLDKSKARDLAWEYVEPLKGSRALLLF